MIQGCRQVKSRRLSELGGGFFSAYATNARLILVQFSAPEKTNEIAAILDLHNHLAATKRLDKFRSDGIGIRSSSLRVGAFSGGEPASTSPENALKAALVSIEAMGSQVELDDKIVCVSARNAD